MQTAPYYLTANHLKNLYKLPPKILFAGLISCAALIPPVATAKSCELPQWDARYEISKYGTVVAQVNMSLRVNDDQAQYHLHTKAVGWLAAFSNEELTELSELQHTDDNGWHLIKFSQQRVKDKQREQQFTVIPAEDILLIEGTAENKNFKLNSTSPIWDRSSSQLALTCDLLGADKPNASYEYNIIDNGTLVNYHFDYRGAESIRIADKQYNTYIFERISGDRSTKFWLTPELQMMPIRIDQFKKGKLHLRMTLDRPAADKS